MILTRPTGASESGVRVITVDTAVYGLTAILKSAYLFTGRAFLHLQRVGDDQVEVRIRPKQAGSDPDDMAGDFLNDLIDQRLREIVGRETQAARDLIVAHALSKTALLNRNLESADPLNGGGNQNGLRSERPSA